MTATITVSASCAAQATGSGDEFSWSGSAALDIGTIQTENDKLDTGLESITLTSSESSETISMNISGQLRTVVIKGRFTATTRAALRTFSQNLKLIANYQLSNASDSTVIYTNTNSVLAKVSTGLTCMVKNISINASAQQSIAEFIYTITLTETGGL